MKTRSQTTKTTFEVDIDFDEASKYWNANKKKTGNGTYKYVCGKLLKTGKFCKQNRQSGREFCSMHHPDTTEK